MFLSFISVRHGIKYNLRTAISAENLRQSLKSRQNPRTGSNSSDRHQENGTNRNNSRHNQHSSSGVSSNSCSSLTDTPPDTDDSCSSLHEDDNHGIDGLPAKSIVKVGPDGSASVVINSSGLVLNNGLGARNSSIEVNGDGNIIGRSSGGRGQVLFRSQRSKKFNKAISIGKYFTTFTTSVEGRTS